MKNEDGVFIKRTVKLLYGEWIGRKKEAKMNAGDELEIHCSSPEEWWLWMVL